MTCRLWIDEVGNADLKGSAADDNIRYLSLTGIITKLSAHERLFQPKIDDLKRRYFGHSDTSPVILHRREMVRGEKVFAVLKDEAKRVAFDQELLRLLENLPYIAITVVIDKREHLERYTTWHYDPYHYCLHCLVERYVLWLRRQNLRGDVAVEPRFKKEDKRVKRSFETIYRNGTENIPPKIMQAHLTSKEIKFFPKLLNMAAMQICDMIAYPSYRSMKFERLNAVAPNDFGTRIASVLTQKRYARNPRTKMIDGWGRKWLP